MNKETLINIVKLGGKYRINVCNPNGNNGLGLVSYMYGGIEFKTVEEASKYAREYLPFDICSEGLLINPKVEL